MRRTKVSFPPVVIRKIHNNGFGSAADYNPLEREVAGRINLLVRKPRRNVKEIPCLRRRVKLPSLAPADVRRSAEDVGDGVLLSMVMDSCAGSWFDQE